MTLVYLTLAWGGGILLGHLLWSNGWLGCATPRWPFGAAAALLLLLVILWRAHPRRRLGLALALMVILGGWRYVVQPLMPCAGPADLAFYRGTAEEPAWVTAQGVVTGFPEVRDEQSVYRMQVDTLALGSSTHRVRGYLLVEAPRFPLYHYGDRLSVTGLLETPPNFDDFDYQAYLARQGIYGQMRRARPQLLSSGQGSLFWSILYALRERGLALINRVLPEPAAGLASGMLLGIETGIPAALKDAFNASGTSHVIVISGSNIALLTGVLMGLAGRGIGKRRAVLPMIAGIALYVLLVGADPSALRAGLMGGLYVVSIAAGRQNTAFVSLFASALFMTLINPLTLWDVGFQLSFMATLGLIRCSPAIGAWFERLLRRHLAAAPARWAGPLLKDGLAVTLAAQVTTLPVLIYYFGRLSLVSLVANFLILPAQPPIMLGGMAMLVAGLIWEPLARLLAVIPWLFLTYTTWVVQALASLSFAAIDTGTAGRPLAVLCGVCLLVALILPRLRAAGWALPSTRRVLAGVTAIVVPLWLGLALARVLPDGRLHLYFVPGSGSEAAVIVTPAGRQVCVWDGRGDGAGLARAIQTALPAAWDGERLALGTASDVCPGAGPVGTDTLPSAATLQLDHGVAVRRLVQTTTGDVDAPPAPGQGWALMVAYGDFRTLLPATLSPQQQAALLAGGEDLRTTVLKAPGPGTGTWPAPGLLAASGTPLVLWPQDTSYPPDVVTLLTAGRQARVPGDSVVEVITDGRQYWLRLWSGGVWK